MRLKYSLYTLTERIPEPNADVAMSLTFSESVDLSSCPDENELLLPPPMTTPEPEPMGKGLRKKLLPPLLLLALLLPPRAGPLDVAGLLDDDEELPTRATAGFTATTAVGG